MTWLCSFNGLMNNCRRADPAVTARSSVCTALLQDFYSVPQLILRGCHPASQMGLITTPTQPSSLVTSLFHLICSLSLFFLSIPAFLPPRENGQTQCQLMFSLHPTSTNFLEALFPSAAWLSPRSTPPPYPPNPLWNKIQSSVRNTRLSVLGSKAVRSTYVHLTDGNHWPSLFHATYCEN